MKTLIVLATGIALGYVLNANKEKSIDEAIQQAVSVVMGTNQ